MKRKKPKFFLTETSHKNITDIIFLTKQPFAIIQSNYTYEVISKAFKEDGTTPIVHAKFVQNMMSTNAMIAGAVIEKEIKEKGVEPPEIDKFNLRYNKFSKLEVLHKANETIYCIDIKSAYLQVLYNEGLIKKQTFENTQKLSKKDRLAAVGLLATNKTIMHHDETGEEIAIENEQKEYAPFFFLCIMKVNGIMQHIANILGADNFIFFWVDGIYFNDASKREEIENYLTSIGFKFTFETLIKFKVKEFNKRHWLSYWQVKEDRCTQKKFCIPKDNLTINKKIIELLELHHEKYSIIKKIKK